MIVVKGSARGLLHRIVLPSLLICFAAALASAQQTTIKSFTLSGEPVSNSAQTASGEILINRGPEDTGNEFVTFIFIFESGFNGGIKTICANGMLGGGCEIPAGTSGTTFRFQGTNDLAVVSSWTVQAYVETSTASQPLSMKPATYGLSVSPDVIVSPPGAVLTFTVTRAPASLLGSLILLSWAPGQASFPNVSIPAGKSSGQSSTKGPYDPATSETLTGPVCAVVGSNGSICVATATLTVNPG
jgi:hypothetical protein